MKLDENLGARGRQLLSDAGHDVLAVSDQNLTSASDRRLIDVCQDEGRCLVTLDLGFSNPFVFPPEDFSGIAVIRLPQRPTPNDLDVAVHTLVAALDRDGIEGELWIVERHRVRKYLPQAGRDDDAPESA